MCVYTSVSIGGIDMALANPREERGLAINEMGNQIRRKNATHYRVRSQSEWFKWYSVTRDNLQWLCTCPDHVYRKATCKHIHAVQFSLHLRQQATLENFGYEYQEPETELCENCGASEFIKKGFRYTKFGKVQKYQCVKCKHWFVMREGFARMKQDAKVITLAMDLHFKGISLRQIRDHLKQFYDVEVWQSTIYYWIRKYVSLMKSYLDKITPNVAGQWHVDETMVNVRSAKMGKGHYLWLWNLMDYETRFILASQIHKNRYTKDAREVLSEGREKAKRLPAILVSDSLQAYKRAVNKEIKQGAYPQPEHLQVSPISKGMENMPIERWHGTLKQRTKVMRGMHNKDTAQAQVDGFNIHYNFIREHSTLKTTPAEKANIKLKLGQNRWYDLIKQSAV